MPGMYPQGEYDLAGFAVGVVEKERIIDGSTIAQGDAVLGLASSGPHSNGYSLIRKIVEISAVDLSSDFNGRTLIDEIMTPTRIYVKPVLELMKHVPVKGIAHITGGGLTENIPRVLPEGMSAVLKRSKWNLPDIFSWLQRQGNVPDEEMHRIFNCGVGMVLIVAPEVAGTAMEILHSMDETAWTIGDVRRSGATSPTTIVE
jgi:phosphoribosylformylglycinamidine cyclo-ligase